MGKALTKIEDVLPYSVHRSVTEGEADGVVLAAGAVSEEPDPLPSGLLSFLSCRSWAGPGVH